MVYGKQSLETRFSTEFNYVFYKLYVHIDITSDLSNYWWIGRLEESTFFKL